MQRARSYLKRWAWLLILCPLLAGGITLVAALVCPPVYEATVDLVFGLTNPADPSYISPDVAAQLGSTYTIMLESPEVLQAAAAQLGLQETSEQLSTQVHAAYQSGSNIIMLTADASSSAMATRLADAVVSAFRQAAQRISPLGKDVMPWGSADLNPVKLKGITFSTAEIAMPLGFLIALSFVALLYYLDDTIFTPDEVAAVADVPVLSSPLPHAREASRKITSQGEAATPAPLLLEAVRASLTWPATIFCVWATARERNAGSVMRLAEAAEAAGLRVQVINTDSRSEKSPSTHGNEALLSPLRFAEALAPLRQQADLILVTGGPLLAAATAALTPAADGVILLAGMQCTRRCDVRAALALLHRVHARVLGIALESPQNGSKSGQKHRVDASLLLETGQTVVVKEIQEFD